MKLSVTPAALETAAQDISRLGTTLSEANALVSLPTTAIPPSGADEVSAAISSLFSSHGQLYQDLAAQAEAFRAQFGQLLSSAGQTYQQTELAAEQLLWNTVGRAEQPLVGTLFPTAGGTPPALTVPTNSSVALIVGGTTESLPSPQYVAQVMTSFINGPLSPLQAATGQAVYTPEQFWPVTPQLGNLTLGQSIAQGTALLNTAIQTELGGSNKVVVWGTSQSSVILTNEIRNLMAAGSPNTGQLSFILTGNPDNPNGGTFERFTGLYIPGLDALLNGATPPNSPYQTVIFSNEYDGASDFPQYPLNVVSDANAVAGFLFGAHYYSGLTPTQVSGAIQLLTSPGYTGNTAYYMTLTQNLPLVTPLRYIPYVGNAIADLLQPDLRVFADLGYGTGDYANIPTPAQLFEIPDPFTLVPDLLIGTVQGPQAALVDLGVLPASDMPTGYPFTPALDPGLNFPTGQPPVTAISLATGLEGQLMRTLGLIPPWDS